MDLPTEELSRTRPTEMTGQWVGRSYPKQGEASFIMVNVEARSPDAAVLMGVEPRFQLRTLSDGSIRFESGAFRGKTWNYSVFDPVADAIVPLPVFYRQNDAKTEPPKEAEYWAKFDGRKLSGSYKNDLGQEGNFELWRSFSEAMAGEPPPAPKTLGPFGWDDFKKYIARFHSRGQVLFRGQHSNAYPLRPPSTGPDGTTSSGISLRTYPGSGIRSTPSHSTIIRLVVKTCLVC